jgi:hypothetical protein
MAYSPNFDEKLKEALEKAAPQYQWDTGQPVHAHLCLRFTIHVLVRTKNTAVRARAMDD